MKWPALIAFFALSASPRAGITVATAASLRFAMEDLRAGFRGATGIEAKAVYGSSGRLCAQIRDGAPFDVFVSADMDFPDSLAAWGYAAGKPRAYGYGKLALWTMRGLDVDRGLPMLADPGVKRIALADPARAPYGREALKALRKSGLDLDAKLVFGESIAQVNQYVLLGNADAGITAMSIVLAPDLRGKGVWREVDSALYDPIAQGAVVCKHGALNHPGPSARFLEYLHSPPARAILGRYGYRLP